MVRMLQPISTLTTHTNTKTQTMKHNSRGRAGSYREKRMKGEGWDGVRLCGNLFLSSLFMFYYIVRIPSQEDQE